MKQSELLAKLVEQNGGFKESLARIEVDLKEHMRRTAILEGKTDRFERFMYMTHGIVALLLSGGAILTLLKYIL